ncbi:MAG: EutN/CcmL family microcompartment protein [Propionibacteriaceae bacterium]|jgi:ethanolamine utilization protein EutN|nr:EutN/CcmL family microcompartment protein [Propionibacteriaceae bacterium]
MIIGKIIGNVWATRKNDDLNGCKLMVVEPYEFEGHSKLYPVVAVDMIGAGVGETVLVVSGSSARLSVGSGAKPIDHAIVGIVDEIDLPT